MFDLDFGPLIKAVGILLAISVPLGLWKLFDIAYYVFNHLRWE